MLNREPKAGDLVQVWDTLYEDNGIDVRLDDHGRVGYVIGPSKKTDKFFHADTEFSVGDIAPANCYKVVFLDDYQNAVHIDSQWLRVLKDHSQIKRVDDAEV